MRDLKDIVSNNKKVRFVYFRDHALHYETQCGFIFPVSVHDTGSATFNVEEKALLMMRYIRKHLKTVQHT